jgi:hypothetical protein
MREKRSVSVLPKNNAPFTYLKAAARVGSRGWAAPCSALGIANAVCKVRVTKQPVTPQISAFITLEVQVRRAFARTEVAVD